MLQVLSTRSVWILLALLDDTTHNKTQHGENDHSSSKPRPQSKAKPGMAFAGQTTAGSYCCKEGEWTRKHRAVYCIASTHNEDDLRDSAWVLPGHEEICVNLLALRFFHHLRHSWSAVRYVLLIRQEALTVERYATKNQIDEKVGEEALYGTPHNHCNFQKLFIYFSIFRHLNPCFPECFNHDAYIQHQHRVTCKHPVHCRPQTGGTRNKHTS